MVELVSAAARSDWEYARRIAVALEPYFSLVRLLGQPRTVKAAMQLRGLPGNDDVRLPYLPLDDSERKALRGALADCDSALTEVRLAGQGRAGSRE
jgi:4-hydroxy-tetrahydrodipicolinate synthase